MPRIPSHKNNRGKRKTKMKVDDKQGHDDVNKVKNLPAIICDTQFNI